jgi:hypothetical protein
MMGMGTMLRDPTGMTSMQEDRTGMPGMPGMGQNMTRRVNATESDRHGAERTECARHADGRRHMMGISVFVKIQQ